MDGEDSATANPAEDISKWSVEDVCGFISSLAGCAEYAQVSVDGDLGREKVMEARGRLTTNHRRSVTKICHRSA